MSQFWQKKQPMLQPAVPSEKTLRAGKEMVERLLLDGIDLQRGGRGVAQAIELPALVDANEAEAALPFADVAMPRAKVAVDAAVRLGLPPASLVQFGFVLQNLQVVHELFRGYPRTPYFFLNVIKTGHLSRADSQEYQSKRLIFYRLTRV